MTDPFHTALVRELPTLRPLAARLIRKRSDTDDLIQSTALSALEWKERYVEQGQFRAWLMVIMYRQFYTMTRKAIVRDKLEHSLHLMLAGSMKPAAEWSVVLRDVRDAFERINPTFGPVLMLDALGHTLEEMAESQGIALGTVKSRLSRARERIKYEVGELAA